MLSEVLNNLTEKFRAAGFSDAAFESRQLVQEALGLSLADIVARAANPVSPPQLELLEMWTKERLRGLPLAYLSQHKGFFKHDFLVAPGVLIPRPETEIVVEVALERIRQTGLLVGHLADFGCGSGCIGLSLASEWASTQLTAVDSSSAAIEVTNANVRRLKLQDRVTTLCTELEKWTPKQPFDLVVANPPYIPVGDERVDKAVHEFEPHAALYSGPDGLEAFRSWSSIAHQVLLPGGLCVFEFGAGQSAPVREIMELNGFKDIEIKKDLAGIERVISAHR